MTMKTLRILIALMVLVAALTVLVTKLLASRSGGLLATVVPLAEPVTREISTEVQECGELQLRNNACDAGLFNKSGSLIVKISL